MPIPKMIRSAILVLCILMVANAQSPFKDDGKPPPNPFGETDPPLTTAVITRPTPPPLNLGANNGNANPNANANPNPNVNSNPNANPIQAQPAVVNPPTPPPLVNPPTPPPLPTPPPIGAGAGLSNPDNGNALPGPAPIPTPTPSPIDNMPTTNGNNVNPTFNAIQTKKPPITWKTKPQDDNQVKNTNKSNGTPRPQSERLSGPGWPRVPQTLFIQDREDSFRTLYQRLRRRRRQKNLWQDEILNF